MNDMNYVTFLRKNGPAHRITVSSKNRVLASRDYMKSSGLQACGGYQDVGIYVL